MDPDKRPDRILTHALVLGGPAALGAGFIAVVPLNHWLFSKAMISARGAIAIEFAYLLVFAAVCILAVSAAVLSVRARRVARTLMIIAGMVLGLYLVGHGIGNGAAILYAT